MIHAHRARTLTSRRARARSGVLSILCTLAAATASYARSAAAQEARDPNAPPPSSPASDAQGATPAPAAATSPAPADAAPAATTPATAAETPAPPAPPAESPTLKVTVGGYAEAYYSYNFNTPENGITNFRWIDNRHNTFKLQTAVLDVSAEYGAFTGHIALQAGPTATGWYADSVEARAGASGAAPLDSATWKILQQATVGWRAPIGRGLLLQAGLFLTPIGFEGPAVKDNYNWSRSNLFFALPFYHAGVRASYELTDRLTVSGMLVNGWNSATDVNDGKSGIAQVTYKIPDLLSLSVLYMGGPERAQASPEGRPFRHLFDGWAEVFVHKLVSLAVHGNAGFENGAFGTQSWKATALYARVQPLPFLYLAARGDAFFEDAPSNDSGSASSIFFGSDVYSVTGTIDLRPMDHLSFRTEYRHDSAKAPIFFKHGAAQDATGAYIANADAQDTVTVGLTGWF
ncbi:outer membrane beta-barrel protein [Pendulispora albinea]|uniref:Porin n=1 Tax=Pendulispora albinea TaxID=2741071 RepID=A0ABZ2LR31_9BACT